MSQPLPPTDPESAILASYWRGNLRLMGVLLLVWAIVGPGCGILFADFLNEFSLPGTGYPLGFWFAQQGSIIVFVGLILVYAWLMNLHDKRHHAERERVSGQPHGANKADPEAYRGAGI